MLEADRPRLQCWFCPIRAVSPGANHRPSLSFGLLIRKVGIMSPTHRVVVWAAYVNMLIYNQAFDKQCLLTPLSAPSLSSSPFDPSTLQSVRTLSALQWFSGQTAWVWVPALATPATRPWVKFLTSWFLSFPRYKTGTIIVPTSHSRFED